MSLPIFHTNIFLFIAFASQIFYAEFISSESKYYDKVKSWCSGAEFDVDSPYKTKLIQLLNSLPSSAGKSINNGYFATNKSSDSETIYARFLCRGDTTPDTCQGCVSTAISHLPLAKCLSDKSAVIWYGECMVQYSNKSFQGIVDEYIHEGWRNIDHVSSITDDVNGFMTLAGDTIQNLTSKVNSLGDHTREGDSKYYLIKDVAFNSFIRIYTMVQCTPDLNPLDCGRCLNIVVNEMATYCNGYKGGRVLNPSCYARYETYPYASTAPDLVPSRSPPPPRTSLAKRRTKASRSMVINISLGILVVILIVLVTILVCILSNKRSYKRRSDCQTFEDVSEDFPTTESLQYDFGTLEHATNNFSDLNKLGEGGFGIVYKGLLPNGQEVAIKRLSKGSHQGAEQFKNEVMFVAKLQHRNLVQLLGYCLAPEEKLLVYEFVPNKSLDVTLFDPETTRQLDWPARHRIIHGIARGILYLHEDSRVKIIHRDLKASNVLLDASMNPKISDFGLARNFAVDQSQDQTSRLAGTLGYMAPEYMEYGEISTKSDVYSFGALVLEIISGKKINDRKSVFPESLLTYSWRHFSEGTPLEVIDPFLGDSYSSNEVIRCLHLGLL